MKRRVTLWLMRGIVLRGALVPSSRDISLNFRCSRGVKVFVAIKC